MHSARVVVPGADGMPSIWLRLALFDGPGRSVTPDAVVGTTRVVFAIHRPHAPFVLCTPMRSDQELFICTALGHALGAAPAAAPAALAAARTPAAVAPMCSVELALDQIDGGEATGSVVSLSLSRSEGGVAMSGPSPLALWAQLCSAGRGLGSPGTKEPIGRAARQDGARNQAAAREAEADESAGSREPNGKKRARRRAEGTVRGETKHASTPPWTRPYSLAVAPSKRPRIVNEDVTEPCTHFLDYLEGKTHVQSWGRDLELDREQREQEAAATRALALAQAQGPRTVTTPPPVMRNDGHDRGCNKAGLANSKCSACRLAAALAKAAAADAMTAAATSSDTGTEGDEEGREGDGGSSRAAVAALIHSVGNDGRCNGCRRFGKRDCPFHRTQRAGGKAVVVDDGARGGEEEKEGRGDDEHEAAAEGEEEESDEGGGGGEEGSGRKGGRQGKGAGLDGEEEGGAREGDGEDDEEQVAGKGGAEKPVGCSKCRWKGCGVCREPKRAKQKDDRKRARPPDG